MFRLTLRRAIPLALFGALVLGLALALRACAYLLLPDPGQPIDDSRMSLKAGGAIEGTVRLRAGSGDVSCEFGDLQTFDIGPLLSHQLATALPHLEVSIRAMIGSRPAKLEIDGDIERHFKTSAFTGGFNQDSKNRLAVRFTARDEVHSWGGHGAGSEDQWLARSGTVTIVGIKADPDRNEGQVWGKMHVTLEAEAGNPDRRELRLDGGWLCNDVFFGRLSRSPAPVD